MYKIALIGAGQIGSRHLQSMALLDEPVSIEVVDPVEQSRDLARARYNEVAKIKTATEVTYHKDLTDISDNIDVAIIATGADVRRQVIESLLAKKKVKYFILEKILFQKKEDYWFTEKLLKKNNVKAWVNCPRRMWPLYRELGGQFDGVGNIDMLVSGDKIGLGCNGIHYLDLFCFMTRDKEVVLDAEGLSNEIIPSKRDGCIEFTGMLQGLSRSGHRFGIVEYRGSNMSIMVQINSQKMRCLIDETNGCAWISAAGKSGIWEKHDFSPIFQSKLTHLALEQLIRNGDCELTGFNESMLLHLSFLSSLQGHLQKVYKRELDLCPIT
jgi:hypothetical protein